MQSDVSLDSIKASLLRAALLGGRGAWARAYERSAAAQLVEDLEQCAADPPQLRDGTWELILSDVEPFRASTFFLALGEAVEQKIASGASDGALTVHSLATGGGEVGRVAHVIEDDGARLHSLVELRSGSLPSLPLALTGTVVSSAELSRSARDDGTSTFEMALKNTTVQQSHVRYGLPSDGGLQPGEEPSMLSWVGNELVASGAIFARVLEPLGGAPTAALRLSFSDDELMVWRTPGLGDHYFVLARGEPDAWPAMDELRSRQASGMQQPSLLGAASALGMLNPFFTRAAGLRK